MTGERILVVDDGAELRDFVAEHILVPYGYQPVLAKDGRQALQIIEREPPDLMLLDYQMPRMNGAQVLHELAAHGWNVPTILMTFYGSEEVAIEVYRLGVRDYIKKPFTVEEMLGAIENCLSDVRLRRENEALSKRLLEANRDLRARLQEMNVFYTIGKSVAALMEIDQLLPLVVDAACRLTGGSDGALYLVAHDRLICEAQRRRGQTRSESVHVAANDPIAMNVARTGQPALATHAERGAHIYVPLMVRNQVLGVLGVRGENPAAPFTNHHLALMAALSDHAAIALQNARTVEQLRQTKENEKARIRSMFQRFVPPQVVERILENPEGVALGGTRREISILFVDIRGYTALSESLPPEAVIAMLNDYLSLAANVIMSYGGTLDKYMGDGLMAIFNAPEDHPDHVYAAMEAALTLRQGVNQLAANRGDGGSPGFGIGVHVGDAVVGFIGTDSALNYTAVGDAVNVAKRLQEAARSGQIIVAESTVARAQAQGLTVDAAPLGDIKMKGRQNLATAYELLGVRRR
jgi:class 3 adenylate cyclase/DNA-binding response OmpR family regulator